jgi:ankyrin repeat and zinc finger domain-containing protein 1
LTICWGIKALEDSLSGSASSSSDGSEDDSDDAVAALIEKHKKHHIASERNDADDDEAIIPRSPISWFQSPEAPNTQLGAYNVIFPSSASLNEYPEALRGMQDGGSMGRSWALFMTAGGHFAGMIARVSRPGTATMDATQVTTGKKPKGGGKVPDLEILSHKTFHRYTSQHNSPYRNGDPQLH